MGTEQHRPHEDVNELRELAEQLLEAARGDLSDQETDARVSMLLDAYNMAVERRRAELKERLEWLRFDQATVQLDAAQAVGIDTRSLLEPHAPTAIDEMRRLAREAPDGATRAEARRFLEERGIPLDEDTDAGGD